MKKYIWLSVVLSLVAMPIVFSAKVNFFPDVHVADWFYPYVEEVRQWGVINGNDDGTFAPERNINRAEFSKMLALYDQRVDEKISALESNRTYTNLPSIMYLEKFNDYPAECPTNWTEVDFGVDWQNTNNQKSYSRTCITNKRCQVMHLELFNEEPAKCPDNWQEADYGARWKYSGTGELNRTCYICR